MDVKQILMPDGSTRKYFCGDDQTWNEIISERILPQWEDYCNSHWISSNHEDIYAPEKRVKWFLDRLAFLLTMGTEGVESEYKTMVHKVREIPVTECPPAVSDYMYSDRKPPMETDEDCHFERLIDKLNGIDKRKPTRSKKNKKETRFMRIEKIIKEFPNSKRTWCIVNADNEFVYGGKRYSVPEEMQGYFGDGQMDRVFVVETDTSLRFYDQNVLNAYIAI